MSPCWLANWIVTLNHAISATPHEALHGISLAQGWQYIHAYLVSEGATRRWVIPAVGDVPETVRNWRRQSAHKELAEEELES